MLSSTATRGRKVSTVSSWKLDASTTQIPPEPAAGVPTAPAVGDGDPRAARRAQPGCGDTGAPEPDHEHASSLQIDRHRTLSVSNSPRIAQANDTIQKRTTIRDSGQPFFSKWWWIGAIRN